MYTLKSISKELNYMCNAVQKVTLEKKACFTNCYCSVLAANSQVAGKKSYGKELPMQMLQYDFALVFL